MYTLLLIFKSIITLSAVLLAVFSIFKDWKFFDRRTKNNQAINKGLITGWIIFGIFSVLIIWINPYLDILEEKQLKEKLKPDINITFYERKKDQIVLDIQPTHKETTISSLSLKFNIPGVFDDFNPETVDRIGKYKLHPSFSSGINSETIAETVHIWIEKLPPTSYFRVEVDYIPTKPRPIPGSENTKYEEIYMPIMDLHDIIRCDYTWFFKGKEQRESKYINLAALNFIKEDNKNVLYNFQGIKFEEMLKKQNPNYVNPRKARFTKKWLTDLEESRKDW